MGRELCREKGHKQINIIIIITSALTIFMKRKGTLFCYCMLLGLTLMASPEANRVNILCEIIVQNVD